MYFHPQCRGSPVSSECSAAAGEFPAGPAGQGCPCSLQANQRRPQSPLRGTCAGNPFAAGLCSLHSAASTAPLCRCHGQGARLAQQGSASWAWLSSDGCSFPGWLWLHRCCKGSSHHSHSCSAHKTSTRRSLQLNLGLKPCPLYSPVPAQACSAESSCGVTSGVRTTSTPTEWLGLAGALQLL